MIDRLARLHDLEALHRVMGRSIAQFQAAFLTSEQVAASHKVMGLDSQMRKPKPRDYRDGLSDGANKKATPERRPYLVRTDTC